MSVPVECPHPGTPHPDGHNIYLLPTLGLIGGAHASKVMNKYVQGLKDENGNQRRGITNEESEELGILLGHSYVKHGAVGWDLEEPFDVDVLLANWAMSQPVAEKADELYSDAFLGPLAKAVARSSHRGRTAPSISARKPRSRKPRTQ